MPLDRLLAPDLPAPLAWCVLVWLFAVGACIGSFMNVVIYRLPAGLSLLHPASRCPACETPIRATDNVPIVGWLWLRGRCRHCRASISPRYPAVELLVAMLFVGLAWAELFSAASRLPVRATDRTMAESWGIYAYHLFLLCSLICAAFIEFDGHSVPLRLSVPALFVGLAAPLVWPQLRPMAVVDGNAVVDGLLGVASGAIMGLASWPVRRDFAVILACVGAFLGWQAAAGLAVVSAASRLLTAIAAHIIPVVGRIGLSGSLVPATLAWIVAWKQIVQRLPWLGVEAGMTTWLAAVACVAVLAFATRLAIKE